MRTTDSACQPDDGAACERVPPRAAETGERGNNEYAFSVGDRLGERPDLFGSLNEAEARLSATGWLPR